MSDQDELERYRYLQLKAKMGASRGPSMSDRFIGGLQNAGTAITGSAQKLSPYMAAGQKLQDIVMPGSGIPEMAMGAVNEGFNRLGEGAAGAIGKHFPKANPLVGGTIGMGIANIPMLLSPGESEGMGAGRLMKPAVPAERTAGAMAALRENVPLSRAEQTGGKFMTGAENFTEKSVLGAGPMGKFRAAGDAAMEALKSRILEPLGPPKEKWEIGYQAKPAMAGREGSMRVLKDNLFSAVPDGVSIPLKTAKELADTLTQEQSKLYKGTRDPEVLKWSKIVADAETSSGKGVTGGPDKFGETISVGPEKKFAEKPNYYPLKRMREQLGEAIGAAKAEGKFSRMRDLTRLKKAVDGDIETFASAKVSPLDNMVSQEFKSSYQKANAFSGAYKKLFKGDLATTIESLPPEKILDKVFQKNSETTIKQFRALVGEDAFQAAKSRWVNDLLESPNIINAMSRKKIDPGTLGAILSGPEQEKIAAYGQIQQLRKTVQSQQGTQGSARSNIAGGQWAGLGAGLAELLRGEIPGAAAGIGQFLTPFPAAKLLTSDLVTKGIPASMGPATTNMGIRAMLMKRRQQDQ